MAKLTETQEKAFRLAYLLVGAALPLIGWKLWSSWSRRSRRAVIAKALDEAGEDSFPASDPPSTW